MIHTKVPIVSLTALELRDRLARGSLSAVDLAQACLEQIAAREPEVQAWAWLESEHVLDQARTLDRYRQTGRPLGPLHGLPVALKDIIDTRRIPTENGTSIDAGRVPAKDATVVDRLRAAGAVIAGKTVTTELAFLHPGKTRNPANGGHTPGGSSSGSAAAVAAGMVPLAVGTQTGGSVIRPAAYCGVVGFKPTFGSIPRTGILSQSPSLDTVGVFARTVEDAALLSDALFGYDAGDRSTNAMPPPRLLTTARSEAHVRPTFAFVRPPGWEEASEEVVLAMRELSDALGEYCFEAVLPKAFEEAVAVRERINFAEMAKCYHHYERRGGDQLSEVLRAAMQTGSNMPARDYIAALDWPEILNAGLAEIFQRCDAILTPATPSPAPAGLGSTGSSIFNGLWTLCGTPAVTLPLLESEAGLPMGVQLVGPQGEDARLLRTARWLATFTEGMTA
ncbi:amidase [Roseitranquillus sediminis]|uniref:amidase n=1 Tax=Roseitranquillus sediminis TaxID=2809051 RepID=UPI001D0CDA9C|nr:amidase [Roseitranquillus sediminis]MBM9596015.1 amidase [Roseitranquillus sediminis]